MQFQLARLATDVEAARLMTYNAARLKDAGVPFLKEAAMAKYFTSQVAERVASECLEVYGGYGFTRDYPAEKFLRDCEDRQDLRGHFVHATSDHREDNSGDIGPPKVSGQFHFKMESPRSPAKQYD